MTSRGYDPRTEQLLDLLKGAGINEREQAYLAVALADQEGLPRAKQDQLALDLGLQIEPPEVDRAPARIDAASGDPEAALRPAWQQHVLDAVAEAGRVADDRGGQLAGAVAGMTLDTDLQLDALLAAIVHVAEGTIDPAESLQRVGVTLLLRVARLLRAPRPRGANDVDAADFGAESTLPGDGKDVP